MWHSPSSSRVARVVVVRAGEALCFQPCNETCHRQKSHSLDNPPRGINLTQIRPDVPSLSSYLPHCVQTCITFGVHLCCGSGIITLGIDLRAPLLVSSNPLVEAVLPRLGNFDRLGVTYVPSAVRSLFGVSNYQATALDAPPMLAHTHGVPH